MNISPLWPTRQTLQDGVYQQLKKAFMLGEFSPGQFVTVKSISDRMSTSAMPVREAIRRLASERALELLPNGSMRVRMVDDLERVRLLNLRVLLEGMAAELAATRITASELKTVERHQADFVDAYKKRDLTMIQPNVGSRTSALLR